MPCLISLWRQCVFLKYPPLYYFFFTLFEKTDSLYTKDLNLAPNRGRTFEKGTRREEREAGPVGRLSLFMGGNPNAGLRFCLSAVSVPALYYQSDTWELFTWLTLPPKFSIFCDV
uniref:Secreted protein n=1 Tax=Bursaphelenchus xylophilus TaxID=6326 RepID=A0A1I7SWJ4_BURXY